MGVVLEQGRIALPSGSACVTFSAEAREVFQKGARSWRTVLQAPALALQSFGAVCDEDAVLWVEAHDWTDADNTPGSLVTLYFGTDAVVSREQLAAFTAPLQAAGVGWSADGVHPAPEGSFPALALHKEVLHHVWVDDDGAAQPYTTVLRGLGNRARRVELQWNDSDARDFLPQALHRVGAYVPPTGAHVQQLHQLKLAFAHSVAVRVVEADGEVKDDEHAFLERVFPKEDLQARWLDDPAIRDPLARQAEQELRDLLGYHEKLALLSTFFAACYADGRLEVRELRVLKEASEALGLEKNDVVAYLQKIW